MKITILCLMPLSCCIQANWFCAACKASGQDKLPQRPQDLQGRARAPAHRPPARPQLASAPPRPPAAQSGPQSGKKQDTSCVSPAGLLAPLSFTEEPCTISTLNACLTHCHHQPQLQVLLNAPQRQALSIIFDIMPEQLSLGCAHYVPLALSKSQSVYWCVVQGECTWQCL